MTHQKVASSTLSCNGGIDSRMGWCSAISFTPANPSSSSSRTSWRQPRPSSPARVCLSPLMGELEAAQTIFTGTGVSVTTDGCRKLRSAIGTDQFVQEFVASKVTVRAEVCGFQGGHLVAEAMQAVGLHPITASSSILRTGE